MGFLIFFSLNAFVLQKEFVGDPVRNVKVPGNYLMKARQKTKPKYAARYLVRVLFPKETLLCSIMGVSARGRRTLDPNKIAAIRGMLPFKRHRFTSSILKMLTYKESFSVCFCESLSSSW